MCRIEALLREGAIRHPSSVFLCGPSTWTYADANSAVDERAVQFRRASAGHPAALRGANNPLWVINILSLLRAGVPTILIPKEITEAEIAGLIQISGACIEVYENELRTLGPRPTDLPGWITNDVAIAFATSGSTGEPRLALRSHDSLVAEGLRYQELWQATPEDVFYALAPLDHAFAFGATVCAALAAGAKLAVAPFRSPHLASEQIAEFGVTIVALVPAIARALALVDQSLPVRSRLRIAMTGAGPTTDKLSALFGRRWGISLSRNYGSSETGALLASLAPVSGDQTGSPMHGVECSIIGSRPEGGQLWVRLGHPPIGHLTRAGFVPAQLAPGGWWPMGDLVKHSDNGSLQVTGRLGSAIRKGGRFIQPREIESALLSHPAVTEVWVRGGIQDSGEECIEAHIAIDPDSLVDTTHLREYLKPLLAGYKIPNRWFYYDQLPKTWSNKVSLRHLVTPATMRPAALTGELRAYRISNALVAASEIGLLQELAAGARTVSQLASKLACDTDALTLFLDYLVRTGIVQNAADCYSLIRTLDPSWASIVAFERHLQEAWLSAGEITRVLKNGLRRRPFDASAGRGGFPDLYLNAFCGPWQNVAALLLQRKLRLPKNSHVIEIGRSAGRIAMELRGSANVHCHFFALGPAPCLAWPGLPEAERERTYSWSDIPLKRESLDAIVLTNCIHWLEPNEIQNTLVGLIEALRYGGCLAIVDIFAGNANSSQFLLDWLACGGTYWTGLEHLQPQLINAGLSGFDSPLIGEGPVRLILGWRAIASTEYTLPQTSESK